MHVLVVNNIYPPIMAGGAELVVAWLSEGLAARGHRVTVVSTCGPDMEPYPVERTGGVTVLRFFPRNVYWNFARDREKPHRRALWHLRDAWNRDTGRKFRAILAAAPPDIVHTHLIDGFSAAIWRRARQAGVPVVHTAHDYHLLCPRAVLLTGKGKICSRPSLPCRLYRAWHLRTSRDVDLFVSPSRFLLDRHLAAGMVPRAVAVVRNGIPLPERRVPRATDRPRLLMLSRLTVEKGVRVVLRALAMLPRELDFELVIAGRGPLETEVRAAAAGDPRLRFVGYVSGDAKQALLESANYLLIPSLWYENAPVAVIEAAAWGIGVIGSRIGGIPELVRDGATGVLCEPGDPSPLAEAIRGLLTGAIVLRDFDRGTRALVREHSVERMVEAYLGHYERLPGLAGGIAGTRPTSSSWPALCRPSTPSSSASADA
jgi:glycosyltransferase involved in cell wall biosynthesis